MEDANQQNSNFQISISERLEIYNTTLINTIFYSKKENKQSFSEIASSNNLTSIIIEDKQNKFFPCTYEGCSKLFKCRWMVNRHFNSHFCFKLFKCEYENCNKCYKSSENLKLHIQNKHLLIKPYECRYCQQAFSHRNGKIKFLKKRKNIS